jgi:exodeoxyribonuclease VII small subunit
MSRKNITFEAAILRLEEIANLLESSEGSLEESIKLYTEGAELAAFCDTKLKEAEQKITEINSGEPA